MSQTTNSDIEARIEGLGRYDFGWHDADTAGG